MRRHFLSAVIVLLVPVVLLPTAVFAQDPLTRSPIIQGNTELAVDLYHRFAAQYDSFVFSPYSVYSALAMLYGGARGETADQIRPVLGISPEDDGFHASLAQLQSDLAGRGADGQVELGIGTALWSQNRYPLLPEYVELVEEYGAEITGVDYQNDAAGVRDAINAWAAEKTNNRITDVLRDPPHPMTVLVLANAIYFKGNWNAQFKPSATRPAPFYGSDGQTTEVQLMQQEQWFWYREDDLLQVLHMPYVGKELSMEVLLPAGEHDLAAVEAVLTAASLEEWTSDLWDRLVHVYFPKFTMRSDFDLKQPLQSMGVTDVFDGEVADLSGIDGIPNWLFLGFALQKAFIEVNEEGTEAAAVTVGGGCFPAGTPVLTTDGLRPIEEISAGTWVVSFDWSTGEWVPTPVRALQSIAYQGDMIRIQAGGVQIEATGNHPFYVLRGEALDTRPEPLDVPLTERRTGQNGRWVSARDLRVDDQLMTKNGNGAAVTGLTSQERSSEVYNLAVENHHNFAVDGIGILVHNKASAEPSPAAFRADHPFIFMIRDIPTGTILFMGRVEDPEQQGE